MNEIINFVQQIIPWLTLAAYVAGGLVALLAIGVFTYIVHTTYAPLWRAFLWMIFQKPGQEPPPAIAGMVHGFRLALWIWLIAALLWIPMYSYLR